MRDFLKGEELRQLQDLKSISGFIKYMAHLIPSRKTIPSLKTIHGF
jgi:hypothetical protein